MRTSHRDVGDEKIGEDEMMRWIRITLCLGVALTWVTSSFAVPVRHLVVYKEPGRFAGWPANHGVWSWDNEIVVGFEIGAFQAKDRGHAINYDQPAGHYLARSLDGGETWTLEKPSGLKPPKGTRIARVPSEEGGKDPVPCPGGINFRDPGFIMTARMADIHVGPSRFYTSMDRGGSWAGPYIMPDFGQIGIAARTDYMVEGKHRLTMFLTAAKASDSRQGKPICVRTLDGGKTWKLIGYVGPEPPPRQKAIMPSSVRLPSGSILTARRQIQFIDLFRSDNDGVDWEKVTVPVKDTGKNNGNPPHLVRLRDGRLVLTYGYRSVPYGIRAVYSADEGTTWSEPIILRDDGGCWDLGYTRTVERPDGKLVTVYYFNDAEDEERYIAATIWELDQVIEDSK